MQPHFLVRLGAHAGRRLGLQDLTLDVHCEEGRGPEWLDDLNGGPQRLALSVVTEDIDLLGSHAEAYGALLRGATRLAQMMGTGYLLVTDAGPSSVAWASRKFIGGEPRKPPTKVSTGSS